ncbi:Protein of unknown function (DUF1193), putative [Trypanosoma equiperdum]|uniref:Uncharacterized protein n=3 Tax=Trypanozoon TaxID=39700 RepID=Q57US1_TRYB2|nr:hypothetical protein, conserved [Trypanosoma brucei gambiense DAL972]XP_844204.1 hypothetical protein, conserved [Trypanosoma brucei brucei TREU927]AAX70618.1 hypothetical protein, conserved [Trypanosoma brucei]SCU65922.1 Protein of unknown function (DUF1193), putative [Trypanosoma equiperdum]AAZ10645.1 hypothetical protein, conserved [Trypanosoma brucei brucei TREU927]CBH10324.1 hypothetical protein, conserved [Trypanosoma brucei gambiense DAL972]|eukprot:XP_011772614.1 hypothetical protein, conserved [Trypanosoma brucei gambiense DAL972]
MSFRHFSRRSRVKWTRARRRVLIFLVLILMVPVCVCCGLLYKTLGSSSRVGEAPTPISKKTAEDSQVAAVDYILPQEYVEALRTFANNLLLKEIEGDPWQPSGKFTDIIAKPGLGVPLPYNLATVNSSKRGEWEACDRRNAEFTVERDELCKAYLSNLNNMRYIKAMSSKLLYGRTIKFRITYAHNGIKALVKVSQGRFYFEASSEVAAFSVDRALNLSRVPTTVLVALPVEHMQAAAATSPLLSQWASNTIFEDKNIKEDFVSCTNSSRHPPFRASLCAYVSVQLWMHDVHPALETFLELPYKYDNAFAKKYFIPGSSFWPPKSARLRAIGELNDRFIFDFIIGNSDRGMNDHNNFVYGGCGRETVCDRPMKDKRIKGLAKYAFLDHGSGFYSRADPSNNPFSGNVANISICRFRRGTYDALKAYDEPDSLYRTLPLVAHVRKVLHPFVFNMLGLTIFFTMQSRLEKVLRVVEQCLKKYSPEEVFSLPAYWEINIPEEWEGLDELPDFVDPDDD